MSEQEQLERAEAQRKDILEYAEELGLSESDAFQRWVRSGEAALWAEKWEKGEIQ